MSLCPRPGACRGYGWAAREDAALPRNGPAGPVVLCLAIPAPFVVAPSGDSQSSTVIVAVVVHRVLPVRDVFCAAMWPRLSHPSILPVLPAPAVWRLALPLCPKNPYSPPPIDIEHYMF